jgi:hypothetical protein
MWLLALGACSGEIAPDDPNPPDYPPKQCGDALWDRTFLSTEDRECGLGPDGSELTCAWAITFGDGTFTWDHSDVTDTGTVTCDEDDLTGVTAGGETVLGRYHRSTARLTWDGVTYEEGE